MVKACEPRSYEEAFESKEKEKWQAAIEEEVEALKRNNTWELVELPSGKKVIDNRWVFKIKHETSNENQNDTKPG